MEEPSVNVNANANANAPAERAPPRARLQLSCRGVVQGVGFRPAVLRLAGELGLLGSVANAAAAVELDLTGPRPALERFLQRLPGELPPAARLEPLAPRWGSPDPAATGLKILEPHAAGKVLPLAIGLVAPSLSADRAPCGACLRELEDPLNRRHGDPFLSCCDCGPRYTIATAEPWQRSHTTLAPFPPCPCCQAEFHDPRNRRFHAETLSCPACGPQLALLDPDGLPWRIGPTQQGAAAETAAGGEGSNGQRKPHLYGQDRRGLDARTPPSGPLAAPIDAPPSLPSASLCTNPFEPSASELTRCELTRCEPSASELIRYALNRCEPNASEPGGGWPPAHHDAPPHPSAPLLAAAAQLLGEGGILALQGVGGFQLLVDATNPAAVNRLRRRKGRPAKPFALLVADLAAIEAWVQLSAVERSLLSTPAAPIVLLRRLRPDRWEAVAPGSPALGVMLPASPLHRLLAQRFGKPLVCTSGNRSGEPLCTDPSEALQRLSGLADAFLVHNRAIARPLDDSVLQLIDGEPALLRRARGYAPQALDLLPAPIPPPQANLLALGGDLKSAPALALGPRVWLAPHLGDLADPRTQARFQGGIDELLLRHGQPLERIALDPHPGHLAGLVASSLAASKLGVQHHLAHALAVVAERGLALPLLAFCADGLGYGEPQDAAAGSDAPLLWGGELLEIRAGGVQRLASLRPLALPGGERAMVEPRRVALGLLVAGGRNRLAHPGTHHTLAAFSGAERDGLLEAMALGINTPYCSSLGRLFDGVASLLGLCQKLSFEGEGGLRLQGAAAQVTADAGAYPLPVVQAMETRAAPWLGRLDWEPLLEALLGDIASGSDPARCAARFHNGVAQGLADLMTLAQNPGPALPVVLAGGCFQNALLLERCIAELRQRGQEPHWAHTVPTNDGGLALGQIWASRLNLTRINPGP